MNLYSIMIKAMLCVGIVFAAYWLGRKDGAAINAKAQIDAIIKENKDWNNAQNRAERLGAYDACLAVARVHDDCAILLQPDAAAKSE